MGVCMGACAKANSKSTQELVASQKKEILDQLPDDEDKENMATKHSSASAKELKDKDKSKADEGSDGHVKEEDGKEDEKSMHKERAMSMKSIPRTGNSNNLVGKGKTERDNELIQSTMKSK